MLPHDLLRPEAWPAPRPDHVEQIETHVSWVLRGERAVLKVKKPVNLGFLDFREPERRRVACEDEVRLNARLAPDVYLGVEPLVRGADGRVRVGGNGPVVDWAVRMRRLDDASRADVRLRAGTFEGAEVDLVARTIAAFHDTARVSRAEAERWASPSAVARNVDENFDQTRELVDRFVEPRVADQAEAAQRGFLALRAERLAARLTEERVRDGHGDLRLEHVYLDDGHVRVIDCVEFDPRYRVEDVCADVAFLAMDLEAHGRTDLAERFLARYARASDDYGLYGVVDFYAGYRAWVRGKVAALLSVDAGADEETRVRAAVDARRYFLLAVASARPRVLEPSVVCVGGLLGAGKSTVADAVADELSCPVVDADRTRKHLMGVAETQRLTDPSWQGAYEPSVTERVYDSVFSQAGIVLESGRPVVLDASFRSRAMRQRARELARAHGVPFRFVECNASPAVCKGRLARRERGASQSDGRVALFDDFAARYEPIDELSSAEHLVLDTSGTLEGSLGALHAQVTTWPRGMTT